MMRKINVYLDRSTGVYRGIGALVGSVLVTARCVCQVSVILIGLLISGVLSAGEVLNIQGGKITGNREQPKVLYIIPWQQPEGSANLERPVMTQINNVLNPIDRSYTLREIDYYQRIKSYNSFDSQHSQTETQTK